MATLRKLSDIPFSLLIGPQGDPGTDGADGNDGVDGRDGVDGKDGKDGITPVPQWEGTQLNWKVGDVVIPGPDLQGKEGAPGESGGGGGGGSSAQTDHLYKHTHATNSLSIGNDGNRILLADATSGELTVTLPRANKFKDLVLHVKKIDSSANNVVITPVNSELIDGAVCHEITQQFTSIMVVSDGTAWYVI